MRRLLGTVLPAVLLLSVLTACGDDEPGTATDDSTPTASDRPTKGTPGDEVDFELVDTITETAAGGAMSETAVALPDDAAVAEFTAQFETDPMGARIRDAVSATDVPDGMLLYGAVVSIGCDSPSEVTVTDTGAGVVITAVKVISPMVECFAPMTTVALVLIPA